MASTNDKKVVKKWQVVVGLLLVVPFVFVQWLLHSEWLLQYAGQRAEQAVPGLHINSLAGSIATEINISGAFNNESTDIGIQALTLKLELKCLWRAKVCVDQLSINDITINLLKTQSEPSEEPIQLPSINLPITIDLNDLSIANLSIANSSVENGALNQQQTPLYQATTVSAKARLTENLLTIDELQLKDNYCQWGLNGSIQFINNYPLNLGLNCTSISGWGEIGAQLTNTVSNLQINADVRPQHSYLTASPIINIHAALQPLEKSLPIESTFQVEEEFSVQIADENFSVSRATIAISSRDFAAKVNANINVDYQRFPGEQKIELSANVDQETLTLEKFNWQLPQGEVVAKGKVELQPVLSWEAEATLNQIAIDQWQDNLSGMIYSELTSSGQWTQQQQSATLTLQSLSGLVSDREISGGGQLQYDNHQVSIVNLHLEQEQNQILVDGIASPNDLQLQTQFTIERLGDWLLDANGQAKGNLTIEGTPTDPTVRGEIVASYLEYNENKLKSLTTNINWQDKNNPNNAIKISANEISVGEVKGNLNAVWQGSLPNHTIALDANGLDQHQNKALNLHCSGSFSENTITTQCPDLNTQFAYFEELNTWSLLDPLNLKFDINEQSGEVSQFCLISQNQQLCNDDPISIKNGSINSASFKAANMSSQWLQPWLPNTVQVKGNWAANALITGIGESIQLNADVNSTTLAIEWQQNNVGRNSASNTNSTREKPRPAPIMINVDKLLIDWQWQQASQQHQLIWDFTTRNNGTSDGQFFLQGETLEGNLSIGQARLDAFSRLVLQQSRDQLRGLVNADFQLSGNINDPRLNGTMAVQDGAIIMSALPVPVEDVSMNLNVNNNLAALNGLFNVGDSPGTLGGEFYWDPTKWYGELNLKASDINLKPEPQIDVTVSPDISLSLTPELVSLTGEVKVPKAQIEIKELPKQAVTVSSDTVIVGSETGQSRQQVKTAMQVQLGDEVRFSGFGLDTHITGNLNLSQNPGELMRAQGVLQLEEGRYKNFGQDLIINNGDLIFVGDIENPQLRLQATRDPLKTADDVTVGLRATGPARQPRITLYSEPPLSQQTQMSYLLRGTAPGVTTESDPAQIAAQSALSFALESEAGEGLTKFAGRALGIDDLQVNAVSNENGTHIGVSGYLTPKLLVRYGVGVFDTVNSLTLKYQLKKNLYLEAVSGQDNAMDLLWSFQKD